MSDPRLAQVRERCIEIVRSIELNTNSSCCGAELWVLNRAVYLMRADRTDREDDALRAYKLEARND